MITTQCQRLKDGILRIFGTADLTLNVDYVMPRGPCPRRIVPQTDRTQYNVTLQLTPKTEQDFRTFLSDSLTFSAFVRETSTLCTSKVLLADMGSSTAYFTRTATNSPTALDPRVLGSTCQRSPPMR